MNYKSTNDLYSGILNHIDIIPHDIDLIVGIPRSGMLVANYIALLLNKPLTDLNGLFENRIISSGKTKNIGNFVKNINECRKILVVEDSVSSGESIDNCKKRLNDGAFNCQFIFFAAYVNPVYKDKVDCYLEAVELPRIFEWNLFHHSILEKTCMDIDGVLCDDPTDYENDDGENYLKFLENAKPKILPTRKVGYLVSSRLEKYRNETEKWLAKYGVEYGELFMLDCTAEERTANNLHAKFKSEIYKKTNALLFIESSYKQAVEINCSVKKPVFCVETNEMLDGNKKYFIENEARVRLRTELSKNKLLKRVYHLYKNGTAK